MFEKIGNSWMLFKKSCAVLMEHKKLVVFPIVTGILTIAIFAFFIAPLILRPTGHGYGEAAHWKAVGATLFTRESMDRVADGQNHSREKLQLNRTGAAYFAVVYFVSMFFAMFFNVAFYHEILKAFDGGTVSVRSGIAFASTRIPAIFFWSLLAGLVGVAIKKLEQKFGFVGRIILGLVGLTWSAASVFVVPVLVESEGSNPFEMLKTSASTLKKKWGEAIIGYAGLQGGMIFVVVFALMIFLAGMGLTIASHSVWIMAGSALVSIGGIIVFSYLFGVASHVYLCALYVYASKGVLPSAYDEALMRSAWKTK